MEAVHPDVNRQRDPLFPGLWPRYLVAMRKAGVPAKNMQWYERWVGRFAASCQDSPLTERTYAGVREFIDRLSASGGYAGWQLLQADHALFLLYRDIVKAPWIAQWRPVEPSAAPPICVVPGTGRSGGCSFRDQVSQAKQGALDELATRIHAEIRTRGYSWKTEATYRHWAQRLLAFSRAVQTGVGTMLAVWGMRLSGATWDIPMAGVPLPQGAAYLPLSIGGLLIAAFALNLLLRAPDIRTEGG